MTVVQVLTVNLLTDGLPAVALAQDPASPQTMQRPPSSFQALFSRQIRLALGLAGVGVGLAATVAYLVGRETDPGARADDGVRHDRARRAALRLFDPLDQ